MNPTSLDILIQTRKNLHMHPEVSGSENQTQKRILQFLEKYTKGRSKKVANTGVLTSFDSGISGPTVLFRADIDALPIQETNSFAHRSKLNGVSHKCGHDGHTAILLGLAMELSKRPIEKGKAVLLFQPSEENGLGAQAVLKDEVFREITVDYVFALHNLPGFKKHTIVLKEGEFTANVRSIVIRFRGKTAHAAEPEFGQNPAACIADLLHYGDKHSYNHPESNQFFLITPVHVSLGEKAYGIAAGYGEVHLTIRSWSTDLMTQKIAGLEQYIDKIGKRDQLITEFEYLQIFHANVNHPSALSWIKKAAEHSKLEIHEKNSAFKWGEDFGLFTQKYCGAMFGIGAGKNTPALHNPDYDFPDEIIPSATHIFYSLSELILGK